MNGKGSRSQALRSNLVIYFAFGFFGMVIPMVVVFLSREKEFGKG